MGNNIEAPKAPNELFINRRESLKEGLARAEGETKILPLGAFSKFVLTEQPQLLNVVRAGRLSVDVVIERQRELITNLKAEDIAKTIADPDLARIAMLDFSFAMNAVIFSGGTSPEEVTQLNAKLAQATGLPEMMTFEKIISINSKLPFSQMRTFTDEEIGETEKRFYYGHELMNVKLQETTDIAAQSVDILRAEGQQGVDKVVESLGNGASSMKEFADFMKGFMRMPKEHFGVFRQYLSQYPDGTRNASGAFIGMPRLNIRLVGLSPKYEQFLDEGMRYFPINEQSDIQHAREQAQEGDCLFAQCERMQGEPQQKLARALIQVIEPIHDFRLSHLTAVYYHIPQAMPEGLKNLKAELAQTEEEPILDDESGKAKGTGGFLPGPLLRNTLRLDLKALDRLNTIIHQ